jgi:predicted nucleic acid-binding Zn ribbon protein
MPTYEFRCPDGTIVERFFKMSEVPDAIPSPNGDGMAVRMISGGAGLLFKGDGFYITDYGKDGKKDQRAASAKAEGSAAGGSGGGTTPAPATPPATGGSSTGSSDPKAA